MAKRERVRSSIFTDLPTAETKIPRSLYLMSVGLEIIQLLFLLSNDMLKRINRPTQWTDLETKEQYLPRSALHNPLVSVARHVQLWTVAGHSCGSPLGSLESVDEPDSIRQRSTARKSLGSRDEIVLILTSFVCGTADSSCCENIKRNFQQVNVFLFASLPLSLFISLHLLVVMN